MPRRHPVVVLAGCLVGGCNVPTPETPVSPPPVVDVAASPALANEEPEHDHPPGNEPPPNEPDEAQDEQLSEVEQRRRDVADALASLTATSPGGLPSGGLGTGRLGGFGMGHGSLNGPRVSVTANDTNVHGSLPKEAIRRVVRANLNAYKLCYERRLLDDPTLEGKVLVKFVIAPSGLVANASIARGLEADVDRCVKKVTVRLRFPKPVGGGVVIVTYPFVFRTSATTAPPPAPSPP